MPQKDLHEANRASWNAATEAHNSHKRDQAAFFRAGGSTLFPEEIELLGDLRGRSLLHLQCNAGQDTLSLARLGATVTGVDISDTAIDFARQLSAQSGIPATFERADIYDWLASAATTYDVVFSSYGALVWLSDLGHGGAGSRACSSRAGASCCWNFIPMFGVFEEGWRLTYDYMGGTQLIRRRWRLRRALRRGACAVRLSGRRRRVQEPASVARILLGRRRHRHGAAGCRAAADDAARIPVFERVQALRRHARASGWAFTMPEGMPQIAMMLGWSRKSRRL